MSNMHIFVLFCFLFLFCLFVFFVALLIYKHLTFVFLLFAGEYGVVDVPHDVSPSC